MKRNKFPELRGRSSGYIKIIDQVPYIHVQNTFGSFFQTEDVLTGNIQP